MLRDRAEHKAWKQKWGTLFNLIPTNLNLGISLITPPHTPSESEERLLPVSTYLGEGIEEKSGLCIPRDTGAQVVDRLALLVCELQFREFPEPENCLLPHTGRRSRQIRPLMLPEKKVCGASWIRPSYGTVEEACSLQRPLSAKVAYASLLTSQHSLDQGIFTVLWGRPGRLRDVSSTRKSYHWERW